MTTKEFENHRFYSGEAFHVTDCWGFMGKTGRLVEVDFEEKRLMLDMGEYLTRFKADQVEPERTDFSYGGA